MAISIRWPTAEESGGEKPPKGSARITRRRAPFYNPLFYKHIYIRIINAKSI